MFCDLISLCNAAQGLIHAANFTTPERVLNFKELIDEVSQDTKIPAGEVRKVGTAMLQRFSRLIEEQQNFASPMVTLTPGTTPARPATGDKPPVFEQKFSCMVLFQVPPAKPQP